MQDDRSTSSTSYENVIKLNDHAEHDGYMPNVYPPRKMFKTRPVSQAQYTADNATGGMRGIKKLGEYILKRPLQNQKLNLENEVGGRFFNPAYRDKY